MRNKICNAINENLPTNYRLIISKFELTPKINLKIDASILRGEEEFLVIHAHMQSDIRNHSILTHGEILFNNMNMPFSMNNKFILIDRMLKNKITGDIKDFHFTANISHLLNGFDISKSIISGIDIENMSISKQDFKADFNQNKIRIEASSIDIGDLDIEYLKLDSFNNKVNITLLNSGFEGGRILLKKLKGQIENNLFLDNNGTIKGELIVKNAEISLEDDINIPELNIINESAKKISVFPGWGIDISLIVKFANINVHNVNANFDGKINLNGDIFNPRINVGVDLISGKYISSVRDIKLTQGNITFDDQYYIELTGLDRVRNHNIDLELSGILPNPTLSITSDTLDNEDAISMLLFGIKAKDISILQSLQIVQIIKGSTNRKLFWVDNINLKQENSEAILTVEKSINDKIFFEIEKGKDRLKTSIEAKISPNLSLEAIIPQNKDSSFGINWSIDY